MHKNVIRKITVSRRKKIEWKTHKIVEKVPVNDVLKDAKPPLTELLMTPTLATIQFPDLRILENLEIFSRNAAKKSI